MAKSYYRTKRLFENTKLGSAESLELNNSIGLLISESIEKTIKKYNMFSKSDNIPIAFSGGKDSATVMILLRNQGYKVLPVIVDRQDDPSFNSERISENLSYYVGLESRILRLRDSSFLDELPGNSSKEISRLMIRIDNLKTNEAQCTPCYNARTIALTEFSLANNSPVFVIGQHKTDMITSLMKCYWTEMYYNKITRKKGLAYNGYIMNKLIKESEINIEFLELMVDNQRAATDDPPVERISSCVSLVRPLVEVSERIIKQFIGNYPHQSNNCSYRESNPRPFRLLVQWDLDNRIEKAPELEDILYELSIKGLNNDGTLKFRPRNKRNEFYPGFKPVMKKIDKVI